MVFIFLYCYDNYKSNYAKIFLTKLQLLVSQMIFSIIYLNLFGITGLINLNIKMDKIKTLKFPFLYITLVLVFRVLFYCKWDFNGQCVIAVTCRGFGTGCCMPS